MRSREFKTESFSSDNIEIFTSEIETGTKSVTPLQRAVLLATFKPRPRRMRLVALCRSLLVADEVDDARLLAARHTTESAQRAAAVGAACNLEAA